MNNKFLYSAILFSIMVLVIFNTLEAQNKRIGTSAAPELLIPIGARDLALGGSSIANSSGIEAIHWNPAGLGRLPKSAEAMFSSMSYIADIGVSFGAAGVSFGDFGNVAISIKNLSFGDIPLTTNEDPEGLTGKFFSPTYFILGASYAKALTDVISAGLSIKLISEQIDRVSASGIAFDFGVQYHSLAKITGLQVGVAVKNIGPQMKFDGPGLYRNALSSDGRRPEQKYKTEAASFELPSLVEIGLAYTKPIGDNMNYSISSSFTNNNLYVDEYRLGGEFGYFLESIKLFGRAGMGFTPDLKSEENVFGATFGFGVFYSAPGIDITLDFAYRQVDLFDANNVVSVKLSF